MRRALVVGIDRYESLSNLTACVNDAASIQTRLERHGHADGTTTSGAPNWDVRWWAGAGKRASPWVEGALLDDTDGEAKALGLAANGRRLRRAVSSHFTQDVGDGDHLLLYFAGHAAEQPWGSELLASDGQGFSFQSLLWLIDECRASTITVILDCCVSGSVANSAATSQRPGQRELFQVPRATLREGLTILTSSRPAEDSLETHGGGVFTQLLISGLDGAAADITGKVTALGLYTHASEAFDKNAQRPLIKAHAAQPVTLRTVPPKVTADRLREIVRVFPDRKPVRLTWEHEGTGRDLKDPAYKAFHGTDAQNELDHLKMWRDRGLVRSVDGRDFYFLCLSDMEVGGQGGYVELSEFGHYMWDLVTSGAFSGASGS